MFVACCKMVLAALWTEGAFPQLPQTHTHPPAFGTAFGAKRAGIHA